MQITKSLFTVFMALLTSTVFLQITSCAAAPNIEYVTGYWKSTKKLPPLAENDYFHITKDSFKDGKRPVEPITITIKDNQFLIISDKIPMPLEVIESVDKNTFNSMRGAPVEFKRLSKEEYEKGIAEQEKVRKERLSRKYVPKNDPF